ncbi:MAG: hypothetical protein M0R80_00555 [Proteobacteria bacterium]|jgi:hypothetical protein|nr:hypothetical protein [Pseudomonadota bacterium]
MKTFAEFSESQFGQQRDMPAWQIAQTTERMVLPHLRAMGLTKVPVELKVAAVDIILNFLGLKVSDLQQHSNQ